MIKSWLLDQIRADQERLTLKAIVIRTLQIRFNNLADDLTEKVGAIENRHHLTDLFEFAIACPDLEAFRVRLASGTSSFDALE
jgi:hypothetical protein